MVLNMQVNLHKYENNFLRLWVNYEKHFSMKLYNQKYVKKKFLAVFTEKKRIIKTFLNFLLSTYIQSKIK